MTRQLGQVLGIHSRGGIVLRRCWLRQSTQFLPLISGGRRRCFVAMDQLLKVFLALTVLLGSTAQAQTFEEAAEIHQRCQDIIRNLDDKKQYAKGKFHARAWLTALNMKGWTAEEKVYLDTSQFTSRHGDGGMTDAAQLLIAMMYAKMNTERFNLRGKTNSCLLGEFSTYKSSDWSEVHRGFVENLSPELRELYFTLPSQ